MAGHRQSKKRRYVTWAAVGAAVVAGAGLAAQSSMAATTWPAQKTYTGRAFDTCAAPSLSAMKAWHTGFYGAAIHARHLFVWSVSRFQLYQFGRSKCDPNQTVFV